MHGPSTLDPFRRRTSPETRGRAGEVGPGGTGPTPASVANHRTLPLGSVGTGRLEAGAEATAERHADEVGALPGPIPGIGAAGSAASTPTSGLVRGPGERLPPGPRARAGVMADD